MCSNGARITHDGSRDAGGGRSSGVVGAPFGASPLNCMTTRCALFTDTPPLRRQRHARSRRSSRHNRDDRRRGSGLGWLGGLGRGLLRLAGSPAVIPVQIDRAARLVHPLRSCSVARLVAQALPRHPDPLALPHPHLSYLLLRKALTAARLPRRRQGPASVRGRSGRGERRTSSMRRDCSIVMTNCPSRSSCCIRRPGGRGAHPGVCDSLSHHESGVKHTEQRPIFCRSSILGQLMKTKWIPHLVQANLSSVQSALNIEWR